MCAPFATGPEGARALAGAMREGRNRTLRVLQMDGNKLDAAGLSALEKLAASERARKPRLRALTAQPPPRAAGDAEGPSASHDGSEL